MGRMTGKSRKRSKKSFPGKAAAAVIFAGAFLMVIFLLLGMRERDTGQAWKMGFGSGKYARTSSESGKPGDARESDGREEPEEVRESDGNEAASDIRESGGNEAVNEVSEFGENQEADRVNRLDRNDKVNFQTTDQVALADSQNQEICAYQDFLKRMEAVNNRKDLEEQGFTVIEEHVFPLELAGTEEVFLVPVLDVKCHRIVLFFAGQEGEIVFRTEQLETNRQLPGKADQKNRGVAAVSFPDVNKDGKRDVVLITLCSPQEDGTAYKVGDVLFQGERSFYRDWRLSEKLNRFGMGRSVKLAVSFAMEGALAAFLYEASTMEELREGGFIVDESRSFWRDFEKLGRLFVAPGYYKMAEYHIFMVYLVNGQGRIVWSAEPMGEYENLYEILGLDSRDIDGDGLKDLTVLARYTLPEDAAPPGNVSELESSSEKEDRAVEPEMMTEKDYAIYYQRTGGFAEDTELKSRYPCGDETTLEDLVNLARSYWGWGTEND